MAKTLRLLAKFVTECRSSWDCSRTVSTATGLKATKAQCWAWPAKFQALPWPWQSTEQQRWTAYGKGVSEYWSYSLRLTVEIFGFIQQNSGAVASRRHGVSQSGPRGMSHTATSTWSFDLFYLEQSTAGSTSNYPALLFFGTNFVILLPIISARLTDN